MLALAYRPSTAATYKKQFRAFMSLAVFLEVQSVQDINFIKCFLIFLFDNQLSPATIASYVSALKYYFVVYNFDESLLHHSSISLLLRAFRLQAPIKIRKQGIIDLDLLQSIILACEVLPFPYLYKALFLLAFFSFCRISNFSPVASEKFDPSRQFIRNDLVWGHPGAHLIIKWAKNMQDRTSHQVVQIPIVSNKILCPIAALQTYFAKCPAGVTAPMFCHPITKLPLIQSTIRHALNLVLCKLNIPKGYITFHSFRRSGATFAFNKHVPLEDIKVHGGWRSSAVWAYLKQASTTSNRVALAFSHNIH